MESTGERIRNAREAAVYGRNELARKAGITPAALYLIESGQRSPRPATVRKIAEALGVAASTLVGPG